MDFKRADKTQKINSSKTYVDAIFGNVGWTYYQDLGVQETEANSSDTKTTEKKQVLDSFKEFTKQEAKGDRVSFPGGEVVIRPSIAEVMNGEELQTHFNGCVKCAPAFIENRLMVFHEIKNTGIKVLFVGDIHKSPKNTETMSQVFTGEVRDLLLKMIKAMKLTENDYALSLLVKCPVLKDQNLPAMVECCLENVKMEIAYYKPQVVITLGALATSSLLGNKERLSSIHGEFFDKSLDLSSGITHKYKLVPLFHPEFLFINPNMKKTTWDDMQKVMKFLGL